jgi:hypothetical protein
MTALVLGLLFVWHQPSQAWHTNRIEIVDVSRDYEVSAERRDIGRPFDESRRCSEKKVVTRISELLGADVTAIHLQRYDKAAWSNRAVVTDYIHRIIAGQPETGELSPSVNWAEGRRVEIEAMVQFRSGRTSRIEFANGYAHVEDDSGCEWWGRYLGPDRSKWIVR